MCITHPAQQEKYYCNTCEVLTCSDCAVLEHNGHSLKPIEQVTGEQRDEIEREVASTVVTKDEVVAAQTELEALIGQIQGNGDAAKKKVKAGFTKLMQEGKKRRDVVVGLVDAAVQRKVALASLQLKEATDSADHSTDAIQLVVDTLSLATPVQVL